MKTNFLAAILLLCVSFFACKKDPAIGEIKVQPSTSDILTGIKTNDLTEEKPSVSLMPVYWKVSRMLYDNKDVSGNFIAFRFEFLQDQTVVVTSKGNLFTFYGKWYMPDKDHLFMHFDASIVPYDTEFEKFLNGEWSILRSSYYGIYMESDENKIHRELGFERIF